MPPVMVAAAEAYKDGVFFVDVSLAALWKRELPSPQKNSEALTALSSVLPSRGIAQYNRRTAGCSALASLELWLLHAPVACR